MISPGPSVLRIADFVNGYPFKPEQLGHKGLPVVRIRQLVDATAEFEFANVPDRPVLLADGDIVLSWSATLAVQRWARGAALLNQHLFRVDPRPGIDGRWLTYVLEVGIGRLEPLMHGSAMTHITQEMLRSLTVTVPSSEAQSAIADYLDRETARIDALIEKKRVVIELLDARWLSDLCFRLLPADTHSQSPYWARRAKEGWTLIPLKRLLARVWAGEWGTEPGTGDVDRLCVRAADFDFSMLESTSGVDRSFTISSVTGRSLLRGDLIIEKSGGGDGVPVGRVVAWRGSEPAIPTNFAGAMRPAPMFDAEFVLLVFRAAYEIGLPWRSIKQTTGLQNLDMGHYLAHRWPVPPIEQQRLVASHLLEGLQEIRLTQRKLQKEISLLQEHRQALITAAVTGELEIPGVAA